MNSGNVLPKCTAVIDVPRDANSRDHLGWLRLSALPLDQTPLDSINQPAIALTHPPPLIKARDIKLPQDQIPSPDSKTKLLIPRDHQPVIPSQMPAINETLIPFNSRNLESLQLNSNPEFKAFRKLMRMNLFLQIPSPNALLFHNQN